MVEAPSRRFGRRSVRPDRRTDLIGGGAIRATRPMSSASASGLTSETMKNMTIERSSTQ
jgi:hypothetical protein